MEMSQCNRVQAIKSKFESLNNDRTTLICGRKSCELNSQQLCKQNNFIINRYERHDNSTKENWQCNIVNRPQDEDRIVTNELNATPNDSYLYKNSNKNNFESKKLNLTRQSSDPGKKLHRSHAFRCDRSQKIGNGSPKRHNSSCSGRSENSEYPLKMEKPKLSKERLKRLGNLLEDRMKKENFQSNSICDEEKMEIENDSAHSSETVTSVKDEIPQHILDLYAKVLKNKKKVPESQENKKDGMTDSGVSSETENLEENVEKSRFNKLKAQFEIPRGTYNNSLNPYELIQDNSDGSNLDIQTDKVVDSHVRLEENNPEPTDSYEINEERDIITNLELMEVNSLCSSSETMKLERKNPHLILTDTLKKALKQPLPDGPPPKKPPRIFVSPNVPVERKNTLKMLEKLEIALNKQEAKKQKPEKYEKPKKEMHYLCTEILDITRRSLTINQNKCLNLNCANISSSYMSLPYTRLSTEMNECNCNTENSNLESSETVENVCQSCHVNRQKENNFRCHLRCKCKIQNSEFYIDKPEHIYDIPFCGDLDEIAETLNDNVITVNGEEEIVKTVQRKTENEYGLPKKLEEHSKSLQDLNSCKDLAMENEKIYDTPCEDDSRPSSPKIEENSKMNFENLLKSFETGKIENLKSEISKPIPIGSESKNKNILKISKSSEAIVDFKDVREDLEKIIVNSEHSFKPSSLKKKQSNNLESKRFKKEISRSQNRLNIVKNDSRQQQDVDKENLNKLMNEIYETVSAACAMAEPDRPTPSKFPTDGSDGATSEDSVVLTRSLTEKRKNYVRRVSSRVAYLEPSKRRFRHQTSVISYKSEILQENPYSTFRSWKSFRCSQGNINRKSSEMDIGSKVNLTDSRGSLVVGNDFVDNLDNLSLDDKAGCLNLDLPFEIRKKSLFDICLLVGFNHMTGEAYVKSVFPSQVQVPPHIENLVFPETLNIKDGSKAEYDLDHSRTQCYSLVLTNEKGERSYGYCRRVLPEGAAACLPLCYCIIGRYRAAGFYYKVLQEIESHHGSTEIENHKILQQLFETDFPNPGTEIVLDSSQKRNLHKNSVFRNSVNLGDILKSKTLPDNRRSRSPDRNSSMIPDFYDVENNNAKKSVSVESGRKLKRPLEPRIDENNLSVLLDSLGAGLLIKVFGSLLLERKVVLVSDNLSQLSSCIEALQCILYPFLWQQPLISTIPSELRKDILEAPLPILAGMLKKYDSATDWENNLEGLLFEEGMLVDLSNSTTKVIFYQGDESTILPTVSYKTLKTSLQLESSRNNQKNHGDGQARNVLIAEAFLRFFVDILADFWQYFSIGKLKDGDLGKEDVVFDKESFVKNAPSKQVQYFLEWFTETAMFNHFVQNMAVTYPIRQKMSPSSIDYSTLDGVADAPLPDFYHVFDERLKSKRDSKKSEKSNDKNYKSVVNKKVKLLKSKLMDLVN